MRVYGFFAKINRMSFGVMVFAELKTVAGNHNFTPAEPMLGSNNLRCKH